MRVAVEDLTLRLWGYILHQVPRWSDISWPNHLLICQGAIMASSLPKLSGMGFKPGEDGLFDSALAVIEEKGYTYINITPSFVLELSSLVEVKQNGEPTSSSTLSVGQFTQILLFMIARTSCFSSTKEVSYLKRCKQKIPHTGNTKSLGVCEK